MNTGDPIVNEPLAGNVPDDVDPAAFAGRSPQERTHLLRAGWRDREATPGARLLALVTLSRPRTWVVCLFSYALGLGYAGEVTSAHLVVTLGVSVGIAAVGNVHNVYTDLDEDAHNLPGRSVLVGRLGLGTIKTICRTAAVAMVVAGAFVNLPILLLSILAAAGLLQYSSGPVRAKGRTWVGMAIFSQTTGLPFLLGALSGDRLVGVAGFTLTSPVQVTAVWAVLSVWTVGKGFIKNLPDFDGDRKANVLTTATAFAEKRRAVRAANLATASGYACLAVGAIIGVLRHEVLAAFLLYPVVLANGLQFGRRADAASQNRLLRNDMTLTLTFYGAVVLLNRPAPGTVAFIVAGIVLVAGSDVFGLDSRRLQEVADPASGGEG